MYNLYENIYEYRNFIKKINPVFATVCGFSVTSV